MYVQGASGQVMERVRSVAEGKADPHARPLLLFPEVLIALCNSSVLPPPMRCPATFCRASKSVRIVCNAAFPVAALHQIVAAWQIHEPM